MEETAETALQEMRNASFSFSCPRKFTWDTEVHPEQGTGSSSRIVQAGTDLTLVICDFIRVTLSHELALSSLR